MACNLPFTMQHQQQTQWCWAAVSTSVALFFNSGAGWTQCAMVNAELGQTTCCSNGASAACNQPWFLDRALRRVGHLRSVSGGTVTFTKCDAEVCGNNHPVCVRIGWSGGGGHFVAIGGVGTPANQMLTVHDPWYGISYITHGTLRSSYQGTGSWTHTYLTQ